MEVDAKGMTVQFDYRAERNYIRFTEPNWMDFVSVVE